MSTPAAAQNVFDFFFGTARKQATPPGGNAYTDPFPGFNPTDGQDRHAGPSAGTAFCVRLCDGRFFPIQRTKGINTAQMCNAFCPASATKIFSGSPIEHAVAGDGTRYSGLPNAFAFRDRQIENCTCNGRDPYGLMTIEASDDPTMRSGDIVATEDGFVVYNTGNGRHASYTPISSYPGLSEWRERLAQTRITPRNATPISPDATRSRATALAGKRKQDAQPDR